MNDSEQVMPPAMTPGGEALNALRAAHRGQSQLNIMADQKANILVGAIMVVLSFLFTRSSQHHFDAPGVVWLVAIFIFLEIVALILGIMVIRPRTRYGTKASQIKDMPNPIFFGFFTRFSEQEYIDYMMTLVDNGRNPREMLLRDMYQLGQILKRKFLLLNLAYNFAGAGILFAAASFVYVISRQGLA